MGTAQPTWKDYFFSPTGRFGRAQFWGASFAVYGLVAAYFLPLAFVDTSHFDEYVVGEAAYVIFGVLLVVAGLVAHVFTIVKRFHDRDKPGVWWLVMFVPYIGGLWILIECGCMPGTDGPNRFGAGGFPSPDEAGGAASDPMPAARHHSF